MIKASPRYQLLRLLRAELASVVRLQAGRVQTLAELARLHRSEAGCFERLQRAVDYVADGQVRFCPFEELSRYLNKWHPGVTVTVENLPGAALVPQTLIRSLIARSWEERISITFAADGDRTDIRLRPTRWHEDPRAVVAAAMPSLGACGVAVDWPDGPDAELRFAYSQRHVAAQVTAALEEAARNLPRGAAPPSSAGSTGSRVYADADRVWKARPTLIAWPKKPGSLYDEWTALQRVQHHPGVCRAISYEQGRDWELMTLARAPGTPLIQVAQAIDPSDPAIARLLLRLADIGAYLRSNGVQHRDFGRQNVLVDSGERLAVVDFDQAALLAPDDAPAQGTASRRKVLCPLGDEEDYIAKVGWQRQMQDLAGQMRDVWSRAPSRRFALDLPGTVLPGQQSLWPRWHAVLSLAERLHDRTVVTLGDDLGLVAILAVLWGARQGVTLRDASQCREIERLAGIFGLSERVRPQTSARPSHNGRSRVVVALGQLTQDERRAVADLANDASLVVVEAGPTDPLLDELRKAGCAYPVPLPTTAPITVQAASPA